MDLKSFLANFLETINYPDDKEEFINKFAFTIYLDTINEVLTQQSQDKQNKINQELSSATTPEALVEIVNNNFDQQVFQEVLKNTSQKLFSDYLHEIGSALTEEQKIKLQEYFVSQTPKVSTQ